MALITLDGVTITNPGEIKLGKFNLTKSGRTASGLMVMEIIATKRKVDLSWSKLSDADLKTILDLLDTGAFHTLTYPDPQGPGGQRTVTAYVGDIETGLWHTVAGVRYWDGVKIPLIER